MLLAWQVSPAALDRHLRSAAAAGPTSARLGLSGVPAPPGWGLVEDRRVVGAGAAGFERLAGALLTWGLHREAGMVLASDRDAVEVGATVANAAALGPLGLVAPCRVVDVVRERRTVGFAYVTLPGHPLVGEERFRVVLDDDDRVHWHLRSVSRGVGLAGLLPPLTRTGQRLVNRRYAAAARRLAS